MSDAVPLPVTAPIGYYGVVVIEKALWQGFFIIPIPRDAIDQMITHYREVFDRYAGSEVYEPYKTVATQDQHLFGGICAALAHVAVSPIELDKRLVGLNKLANILHRLSGEQYFLVSERRERDGSYTTFSALDAHTVEEAQAALKRRPEILMIDTMKMFNA